MSFDTSRDGKDVGLRNRQLNVIGRQVHGWFTAEDSLCFMMR